MDQIQISQVKPEIGLDAQYWNKWLCSNKSGSEPLHLQRDGSWSRGRFYFDTESQIRSLLAQHHPSTVIQEPFISQSSREDDDSDDNSIGFSSLSDIVGGDDSSGFTGGGGDFGGGGAGGDW